MLNSLALRRFSAVYASHALPPLCAFHFFLSACDIFPLLARSAANFRVAHYYVAQCLFDMTMGVNRRDLLRHMKAEESYKKNSERFRSVLFVAGIFKAAVAMEKLPTIILPPGTEAEATSATPCASTSFCLLSCLPGAAATVKVCR